MPSARKIIILCLTRPKSARPPRGPAPAPTPRYLYCLVFGLRLLGFKLATVSKALGAPSGRVACLTFDGLGAALRCAPVLARRRVPATAFVSTRSGTALKQLPALAAAGWEIGSLGHDLVDLTTHGYVEQRRHVARSRSLIANKTGAAPALFSYPFGAYDATTVSCVREAGFAGAVTLRRGLNNGDLEAYHLRRVPLTGQSLWRDLAAIVRTLVADVDPTAPALGADAREGVRTGAML